MFTGIVEGQAVVANVSDIDQGIRLHFKTDIDLSTSKIGDSIALDGVCLTAIEIDTGSFIVEASHETLRCTTMGRLKQGSIVNLERALAANSRLDGHFVQGHVDSTTTLISLTEQGDATDLLFSLPKALADYVVEKGSITIDGVSLTVNTVSDEDFGVTIIPHTSTVTTITDKRPGDQVNLETDIVGKYIVRMLRKRGLA